MGDEVRNIDDEVPFSIPDSWEYVRLKYVGEIVGGGTPKTNVDEYWNGDIPWVTPADLSGLNDIFICKGERNITEVGLQSSSAQLMPAGTVLYSSRAPIGYIAIASNPISTNQGFKSIIPYEIKMNVYLYFCLQALTEDIVQRATGTTFKEISGSQMGEIIISLPSLSEQYNICKKIKHLFRIIEEIEKSLS